MFLRKIAGRRQVNVHEIILLTAACIIRKIGMFYFKRFLHNGADSDNVVAEPQQFFSSCFQGGNIHVAGFLHIPVTFGHGLVQEGGVPAQQTDMRMIRIEPEGGNFPPASFLFRWSETYMGIGLLDQAFVIPAKRDLPCVQFKAVLIRNVEEIYRFQQVPEVLLICILREKAYQVSG